MATRQINLSKDALGERLVKLYDGMIITSTREGGEYVIRLGYPSKQAGDSNVLARHRKQKEALKIAIEGAEREAPPGGGEE